MWIPADEAELVAALANGAVGESHSLDAKVALPAPGRNKDLARDICAMTVDGGLLLYGIGGNDPTRPDLSSPFALEGVAERIDQVAQTAIAEPAVVEVRDFPSVDQPGLGYLVVVVPPSPRAPHMVTLDGENRYYGRGATGNRILTEGEVARLYERRERWEIDRDGWLENVISTVPPFSEAFSEIGPMVVCTKPVLGNADLVRRGAGSLPVDDYLRRTIPNTGRAHDPYPGQGTSGLERVHQLSRQGADKFVLSSVDDPTATYQARAEVRLDGTMTYWHAPTIISPHGRSMVMEQSVTRCLHQHLAVANQIYRDGGFAGVVDLGVALLGIEAATGSTLSNTFGGGPVFGAPDYRCTERVTMEELASGPESICKRVLTPLFEVIAVNSYDPYSAAPT